MHIKYLALCMIMFSLTGSLTFAAEQHMMQSRVPAAKLEEARSLKSPLSQSREIIAKEKTIYEGKGTCVNCHGVLGHGDGPGGGQLKSSTDSISFTWVLEAPNRRRDLLGH